MIFTTSTLITLPLLVLAVGLISGRLSLLVALGALGAIGRGNAKDIGTMYLLLVALAGLVGSALIGTIILCRALRARRGRAPR